MAKFRLFQHAAFVDHHDRSKLITYVSTIMASSHKKFGDTVRPSEAPRMVSKGELCLNSAPQAPLVKMSKQEFVDAFFETGSLQVGSLEYFMNHENDEVRDEQESITTIVGLGPRITTFSKVGAGYNYRVFCCFIGDPTPDVLDGFGYDAGFEIVNPAGFAYEVSKSLGSADYSFGRCAYVDRKVVSVNLPNDTDWTKVGNEISFPGEDFRYFLKPQSFCHQSEMRFIWQIDKDVDDAVVIKCPGAVQHCRRLL